MSSQSLPNPTPCLSYWQRATRAFPHLHENANTTTTLPRSTKYIIIGSGIAGGLTALEFLEAGVSGEEVIILEAREAASGASSRNAGHVRPGMAFSVEYHMAVDVCIHAKMSSRCIPRLHCLFPSSR